MEGRWVDLQHELSPDIAGPGLGLELGTWLTLLALLSMLLLEKVMLRLLLELMLLMSELAKFSEWLTALEPISVAS